jgi:uncharacterized membrane protein
VSGDTKTKALMVVNLILFILFMLQAVSAVMLFAGLGGSLTYRIHMTGGFLMIITASIHITLNFGWIKARFSARKNRT